MVKEFGIKIDDGQQTVSEMAIEMNQRIADNANYDYDSRKNAQYLVGEIHKLQGDNAKAIEAYQKLLKDFSKPMLTPNHPADLIDSSSIIELQEKAPPQTPADV